MSEESKKVVFSGIDQPVKIDFPELNLSAVDAIKNSTLYKNASKIHPNAEQHERLMLASMVTTNGWDTVSICRITALNAQIKANKTYPASISYQSTRGQITYSLSGNFNAWQVICGGDGRNLKLNLPMQSGQYNGLDNGAGSTFNLAEVSVEIEVNLSYFPIPNPDGAKDGSYDLKVNINKISESGQIAMVTSLNDPLGTIDDINQSILRGLFEKWLNVDENLRKFDTLFSTVIINNFGQQSEEYKWLRATAISYAYTDKNTEDSSIFGVLCMTNGRPHDGLPNQIPAVDLQSDDNAIFLISREIFVKYQLLPSLPIIFNDSPDAQYVVDQSGTTINATNLKLDSVRVGAIDYHPIAKSFEICFDETYIRTTATIFTNISPGIDANTIILTKQTLAIGKNENGEQVMTYAMVGAPDVQNSTNIAPWITITEVITALIGAVVISVASVVASKVATLIIGIVVALVVATISLVIHEIIANIIAGKATSKLPAIAPMVKVATSQVQWPFCKEDAFCLTNIEYSGAIIFDGNLKLRKSYAIVNNRLVSIALGA